MVYPPGIWVMVIVTTLQYGVIRQLKVPHTCADALDAASSVMHSAATTNRVRVTVM